MRERDPLDNGTFKKELKKLTEELEFKNQSDILCLAVNTGCISSRDFYAEMFNLCDTYGFTRYSEFFMNKVKEYDVKEAN